MSIIRWILTIVLIVVSLILTVIVLMQEGKSAGLGAIAGASDTYWSKNKGKSKESVMKKITVVLGILYFVLALLLSSKFI